MPKKQKIAGVSGTLPLPRPQFEPPLAFGNMFKEFKGHMQWIGLQWYLIDYAIVAFIYELCSVLWEITPLNG